MRKRRMLKKKFLALLKEGEFYLIKIDSFQALAKLIDHHASEPFYFLGFLNVERTTYKTIYKEDLYTPEVEVRILKGQTMAALLYA